jgi:membrane-associated protein
VVDHLVALVTSPWIYVAVFGVAAADAFIPLVPCDVMIITVSVFAAGGDPQIVAVAICATAGAVVGDTVCYGIGRRLHGSRWLVRGRRVRKLHEWATRGLARRGVTLLIVARYFPWGRTATAVVAGSARYPIRRFWMLTAIGGAFWATYVTTIGYLGGSVFSDDPLRAIVIGVAIAFGLTFLIEGIGSVTRRRRDRENRQAAVPAVPVAVDP